MPAILVSGMKTRSDITPKCLETTFEVCIEAWIPFCGVRWSEVHNRILVCHFFIDLFVVIRITLLFMITLWHLETFLNYVINLMWCKRHIKTDKSEALYSCWKNFFSKYCRLVRRWNMTFIVTSHRMLLEKNAFTAKCN